MRSYRYGDRRGLRGGASQPRRKGKASRGTEKLEVLEVSINDQLRVNWKGALVVEVSELEEMAVVKGYIRLCL